jgi:F-type H+-transporting ATPase subunit delta
MKYSAKQLAFVFLDEIDHKKVTVEKAADGLIHLLIECHELKRLDDVILAIDQIWKERYGVATITIETAHPLTAALRKQVSGIAKGAELREEVDEELIGGARIRIDDRLIDGSIAGHIAQLHKQLLI